MTFGLADAIRDALRRRERIRLVYSAPRTRPAGPYHPQDEVSGPTPATGTPDGETVSTGQPETTTGERSP